MKLTFKITSIVLVTVMSLLLFFGFFIIKDEKEFLQYLQNKQGKAIVNTISISIVDAVLLKDYPAIDTIVENTLKAYKDISSVRVVINNKIVSQVYNKGLTEDEKSLFKSNVVIDGEILARVVSEISNSENTKIVNKRIQTIIIISLLITSLLIVILILIVKYFLISKINFISNSTSKININSLHKLIKIDTKDEFKDLAENINEMTKQLEKEIEDNKIKTKLLAEQSKMVSMGEMIGNIAHQWRQPLSIISTSASGMMLKSEMEMEFTKEDILGSSKTILNQTKYLSNTIDNFRDFLKGDKSHSLIKLSDVIQYTISIVNASISDNFITLIDNTDKNLSIYGSRNELSEAFINIINNSKDALKTNIKNTDDRFIFIDVKEIENEKIEISFKDSGGGIPNSIINRVFEPYFTSKHQSIGTGLGLSMASKIIKERHYGLITVNNEEYKYNKKLYKGACFKVTLNKES
ncbi:hypothetical protein LPB137_05945 [Poseidonibacter parvus]|uniref:histidine kinase n=1 Tax=Poseidonibacter parvus TaxID=1850254 RepID=A0A1P8KLJ4_9BACT|nr:HAMP domain-containing sensor histidine kinase [Poseidonibacter parvus]APW65421.1 hypothetical protein LPB137_05945 [Poseidonibacter parvus]